MSLLRLRRGGDGSAEIGVGDTGIGGSVSGGRVSIGGGDETREKRGKRGRETTDNIGTKERDRVVSGNFFDGAIGFVGVALVRMGLLESLSELVLLIWSS